MTPKPASMLFDHTPEEREDELRADNDFMKMKLMLERGATFGSGEQLRRIPAELENNFLRNVLEFESLNDGHAFITVRQKLGDVRRFAPVDEIDDEHIDHEWRELLTYLNSHQITVGVSSPFVCSRQLYRFVTEELFDLQISSVDMPGLVHGFIYDEFHPDPAFDNPRSAIEGCLEAIFCVEPMRAMHFFSKSGLRLNENEALTRRQFMNLVNHFKSGYDQFSTLTVKDVSCLIDADRS